MDLKQNITFGKKKNVYPTKTNINLIKSEATRSNTLLEIALFCVFLVLIGIFVKFAVLDPLASGMSSSSELVAAQSHLAELTAANADYAKLNEEYSRYVVAGLTESEQNLANRDQLLALLKTKVMGVVPLSSLKVVGNTVTVACVGVGLQDLAGLVQSLEADSHVSYVTVSTAQGKDSQGTSATISITLKGALEQAGVESTTKGGENGK